MYTLTVILTLIILLLLRINFDALKKLKAREHERRNFRYLQQKQEETIEMLDEYRTITRKQSQFIEKFRKELIKQQSINLKLVTAYNNVSGSIIDIPKDKARFFSVKADGQKLLLHFSEN